jgi:hypothetical protein
MVSFVRHLSAFWDYLRRETKAVLSPANDRAIPGPAAGLPIGLACAIR